MDKKAAKAYLKERGMKPPYTTIFFHLDHPDKLLFIRSFDLPQLLADICTSELEKDYAKAYCEGLEDGSKSQSSQSEAVEVAEFLGENNWFCHHNDFSGKSISWYKLNKKSQMFTTNELFNSSEFKKFKESRLKDNG